MFETQTSGNTTSSGEIGLNIRTHASPKVGQDQVSLLSNHDHFELFKVTNSQKTGSRKANREMLLLGVVCHYCLADLLHKRDVRPQQ